jgi:hypothetical protein
VCAELNNFKEGAMTNKQMIKMLAGRGFTTEEKSRIVSEADEITLDGKTYEHTSRGWEQATIAGIDGGLVRSNR